MKNSDISDAEWWWWFYLAIFLCAIPGVIGLVWAISELSMSGEVIRL